MRVSLAILISGVTAVLVCMGQSCAPTSPQDFAPPEDQSPTTQQPSTPPAGQTPGNDGVPLATQAPVIESVPDHNAHSGQAYSMQCRLLQGTVATWSVDLYMSMIGMSIDSSGLITWTTPTDISVVTDHRYYTITVTATNSAGKSEMKYHLGVFAGSDSPPAFINATAAVQPISRTEATVTLSCDLHDAEGNVTGASVDLAPIGGTRVPLARQGPATVGDRYTWQGRTSLKQAIGGTLTWEAVEGSRPLIWHYVPITLVSTAQAGTPVVEVSSSALGGAGASLVYQGCQITGKLRVPANALMGVVKASGETRLYHPALGDVELTNFTSRQAVGYFFDGLSPAAEEAAKDAGSVSARLLAAADASASCSSAPRPLKENITGATGAKLYGTRGGEDGLVTRVSNPMKRWIAVKSLAGDGPYMLSLASYGEWGTDIVSVIQQLAQGRIVSYQDRDIRGEPIEIYGSLIRAIPLSFGVLDPPLELFPERWQEIMKPYMPWGTYEGQSFTQVLGQLYDQTVEPRAHDFSLFIRLNMVEFGHLYLEGVKSILGAIPEECTEAIVKSVVYNIGEPVWIGLFTFQTDQFVEFLTATMKEAAHNLMICGGEALTGPVAAVLGNVMDVAAGLAWIRDWNIGRDQTMENAAFECIQFETEAVQPGHSYQGIVSSNGCTASVQAWTTDTREVTLTMPLDPCDAGSVTTTWEGWENYNLSTWQFFVTLKSVPGHEFFQFEEIALGSEWHDGRFKGRGDATVKEGGIWKKHEYEIVLEPK